MFIEQTIDCGEVLLNVASGPESGPPLLLLHGVTRRWQDFTPLLPTLSARRQVHGLDFRGHGGSGRKAGAYLVVDYVRDALAFLNTQAREPVVLYGHSLGALVAAAVAGEMPGLVRAVVLEDPPAPAGMTHIRQSPLHALFAGLRSLAGGRKTVPEVAQALAELRVKGPDGPVRLGELRDGTSLRFLARCLEDLDPEVLTPVLEGRWLEGFEPERVWRGVRCPALLLRGEERLGGMVSAQEAERMARGMRDCTVLAVSGVGHLIHWLQTETTLRLVTGFLESL
jgi:pimeloyl-ACP methyl ester carboxylesterase